MSAMMRRYLYGLPTKCMGLFISSYLNCCIDLSNKDNDNSLILVLSLILVPTSILLVFYFLLKSCKTNRKIKKFRSNKTSHESFDLVNRKYV